MRPYQQGLKEGRSETQVKKKKKTFNVLSTGVSVNQLINLGMKLS